MKIECTEYQLSVILQSLSERLDFWDTYMLSHSTLREDQTLESQETLKLFEELNEISLERYGYSHL